MAADVYGTAVGELQTSSASWTCSTPAALTGHRLLLVLAYRDKGQTPSTPSGWTPRSSKAHSASIGAVYTFEKALTSGVSASTVAVTFSGAVVGISGCIAIDGEFDSAATPTETGWVTSATPPSGVASEADCVMINVVATTQYPRYFGIAAPSIELLDLPGPGTTPPETPALQIAKKVIGAGTTASNLVSTTNQYGGFGDDSQLILMTLVYKTVVGASPPPSSPVPASAQYSFPSGWASTVGGFGGTIIAVTNTNASGAGSLKAALDTSGARVVVFETSGVIDMAGALWTVTEPYLWVAGQTAPSPGITLIKGSVDIKTQHVIWQHTRIRPGTAAGTDRDAIQALDDATDVIIDHNSLSWGTDEIMSAGGYPFDGSTIESFRSNSAHRITFSNNIIAEPLTSESGYGTLNEDNTTEILHYGNFWVHCPERSPNFGGGSQGAVVNCLIYNPGGKHLDYTFLNSKWDSEGGGLRVNGKLTAIGNVALDGPDSATYGFLAVVGDGDVDYYGYDNIAKRADGTTNIQQVYNSTFGGFAGEAVVLTSPPVTPPGVSPMAATSVEAYIVANVGARPWDRDVHDQRVIDHLANRNGSHLSSQADVGGYPASVENTASFVSGDWDLATMSPAITGGGAEVVFVGDATTVDISGTSVAITVRGGEYGDGQYVVLNHSAAASASVTPALGFVQISISDIDTNIGRLVLYERVLTGTTGDTTQTFNFSTSVVGVAGSFTVRGTRVDLQRNASTQSNYLLTAAPPSVTITVPSSLVVSIVGSGNWNRSQTPGADIAVELIDNWPADGPSLAIGAKWVDAGTHSLASWSPADPDTPGSEAGDFWRLITLGFVPIVGGGGGGTSVIGSGAWAYVQAAIGLIVTPTSGTTATATWQDAAPDETSYEYAIAQFNNPYPPTLTSLAANATSLLLTGLVPGAAYKMIIAAKRGNDYSAYEESNWAMAGTALTATLTKATPPPGYETELWVDLLISPALSGQPIIWSLTGPATIYGNTTITNSLGGGGMSATTTGVGTVYVYATVGGYLSNTLIYNVGAVNEDLILTLSPARLERNQIATARVTGSLGGKGLVGQSVSLASTNAAVMVSPSSSTVESTVGGGEAVFTLPALDDGTTSLTATINGVDSNTVAVVVAYPSPPVDYTASGVTSIAIHIEAPLAAAARPKIRRMTHADQQFYHPGDDGFKFANAIALKEHVFFTASKFR